MFTKSSTCIILILANSIAAFGQKANSLRNELERSEGFERIEILHQLIPEIWNNFPDQALEYGREAQKLSQDLGDERNLSLSLRLIAGVYYYKGDFEISLDYNLRALSIALQLGDSSLINNGYNNIGLIYYDLGSHQTALEYLLRSRKIKESIGEVYGLSRTLNNIGLIFNGVGEYEAARQNFFEALQIARQTSNSNVAVYSLNNIGITYLREVKTALARQYFDSALTVAKQVENINWGSVSLRNIGEIFRFHGKLDSANYFYQESLAGSQSIEDKKGISEIYFFLAKLAMDQGKVRLATEYLDQSHQLASALKIRYQLLENLRLYVSIHLVEQDNQKVIQKQLKYVTLQDSLFKDVVGRNLLMVPIKLKEEADRIRLSEQRVELTKQNQSNQLYITILIFSIIIFLVLVILLTRNRKANKQLVENNQELSRTQTLLVRTEKMASLGVLAAGVGHEINNPLNYIKNGIITLSRKMDKDYKGSRQELKQYFDIIEEGVDRASTIVKSLGHFSRTDANYDQECNIEEIVENCLTILGNKIRKGIEIERNYSKVLSSVSGNEGKLHQLFLNVISNAEQAIERKGKITIITSRSGDQIIVQVKDTGIGISEENIVRIADPFYTTKAPGTGTGLGLFVVYSIIEEHNGDIGVTSKVHEGTEIIIKLPINRE